MATYDLPTLDDVSNEAQKGSMARAAGMLVRKGAYTVPNALQSAAGTVVDAAGAGINAVGSVARNFYGGVTGAQPARTTNAVLGPSVAGEGADQPAYPTQFRNGYDSAPAASAPVASTVAVPRSYDLTPYPGRQVDTTNARMSAPGLTLPAFNTPPPAVAQGVVGSAGVGLLPPELHSQISDLLDAATPLLKSAGIVDRLRGRTLLRARQRLIEGATSIAGARTAGVNAESGASAAASRGLEAQTGAFRATNEVPLALLNAGVHKYATDVGAGTAAAENATRRYGIDTTADTSRYSTDAGVAVHLPNMQRTDLETRMYTSGDEEGAQGLASLGKYPPLARAAHMLDMPAAGGASVLQPDGSYKFMRYDELNPSLKKK